MSALEKVVPIGRKQGKKKPVLTDEHKVAFQVWNDFKPDHWVKSRIPSPEQIDLLNSLFEFCHSAELDPYQMLMDGLNFARQNQWAMSSKVKLRLENFIRKDRNLCLNFANQWADLQERLQAQQQQQEQEKASEVRIKIQRPTGKVQHN